jgi:hypothetical protein
MVAFVVTIAFEVLLFYPGALLRWLFFKLSGKETPIKVLLNKESYLANCLTSLFLISFIVFMYYLLSGKLFQG